MPKIKRVLCPTDMSPGSDEALSYALALSRAYDAKLFVCYCRKASDGINTWADFADGSNIASDIDYAVSRGRIKEFFEGSLIKFIGPEALAKLDWEAMILEGDDAGEAITETASEYDLDLIVMRSRRRPKRAAILGSTAESVCRTAPCPVLVTHSDEREWLGPTREIRLKRLLVAYDFPDYSELALKYALSLAQENQAELHLLHVLPPSSVSEPELVWYPIGKETPYQQGVRRLQSAVPPDNHLSCQVKHTVATGQPYREILNYADKHSIDLISMGAHGSGFGVHTLFGSNVDRVLRQAHCPVIVARPLKPAMDPASMTSLASVAVTKTI